MTRRVSLLATVLLLFWSASVPGCASDPRLGYANVTSHNASVASVSVPVFENITHYHGVETQLTQALMRRIQRTTPWELRSGAAADTTLTGAIVAVTLERLGQDRVTGLGNEMAVDIAVDFRWVDNRTGKSLVARRNFRGSSTFVPAQGVREPIDTGLQGAVESLADGIIAQLRSDW